jgi:hypothetical protein
MPKPGGSIYERNGVHAITSRNAGHYAGDASSIQGRNGFPEPLRSPVMAVRD